MSTSQSHSPSNNKPRQNSNVASTDTVLKLNFPKAELLLGAAQAEVALFKELLSRAPSLIDLITKESPQANAAMLESLTATQVQGAAAHSALQLVRADKLTQHNRDSLTKCKAETKAAMTQIGDLIKRTHSMGNCSTELITTTPLLSMTHEITLFTAMISQRASFWAALYELPMVQRDILDNMKRIAARDLLPETVIFTVRSKNISSDSLIKQAASCVKAASTLDATHDKESHLYATRKMDLVKRLLKIPIQPEQALLLFNRVKTTATDLTNLETKIKCKHGTLQAAELAADPDLLRFRELRELLGGDALHVHKTISQLMRLQAPYLAIKSYLFSANTRMVLSIVGNNNKLPSKFEDLSQEGHIGLLRAIEKFDPSLNVRFATCAHWWISQASRRAHQQTIRQVAIPAHQTPTISRLCRELSENNGRTGAVELAEKLDITKESVMTLLPIIRTSRSLSSAVNSENRSTLGDIVADQRNIPVDLVFFAKEVHNIIQQALKQIPKRDREIVNLRYGLQGEPPMLLQELATLFGLSRERVRQIVNKAHVRLSGPRNRDALTQLLEQL